MRKKIILSYIFLFSLGYAAEQKFEDIGKEHWAYKSINNLLEKNIIKENSYKFNGNKNITKYEFIYSLSKILEKINTEKINQKELKTFEILMAQFSDELNNISFDTSAYREKLEDVNDNIEILKQKVEKNEEIIRQLLEKIDRLEKRR